jgi:hypothetical protein
MKYLLVITTDYVTLPDLENPMTFLSLRTAYKPHPNFKSINFGKAVQLIFQHIWYLSSNAAVLNAWTLISIFIFTLSNHEPLL